MMIASSHQVFIPQQSRCPGSGKPLTHEVAIEVGNVMFSICHVFLRGLNGSMAAGLFEKWR